MHKPQLFTVAGLALAVSCSRGPDAPALVEPPSRAGWESDAAWPGFTLVAPLQSRRVRLVDMAGEEVHGWDTASKPGVAVYLTERGTLLKCQRVIDHPIFQDAGGHGGWIQELDWDGTVLWDFRWDSEQGLNHHDIEELPNGNVLLIAWDRTTREVALAAGRDPELLAGEEFWAGAVYEIQPTRPAGGEVVWSWHALDHVIQDRDPALPDFARPSARPERIDINGDRDPDPPDEAEEQAIREQMAAIGYADAGGDDDPDDDAEGADDEGADDEGEDAQDPEEAARRARTKNADWLHTNGIAYNPALDQIALSVRRYDEVWIIDHATTTEEARGPKGDLLYRWGNPFAYGMGRWEERQLFGQHHVQWIPDGFLGAGNLIVFNNGARPREWSTVTEWWAPRDASGRYPRPAGEPWGPAAPDWSYAAPEPTDFYSSFISGVQRLPNGNTLICCGAPGWVFEITPDGTLVWDWRSPFGPAPGEEEDDMSEHPTALFRATRYAADSPHIAALRARGAPIPADPGVGPATHQYVPPAADGSEEQGEGR